MAINGERHRTGDINNTGFGANSSVEGGRLVNADGTNNLRKRGVPLWQRISLYHSLLRMKRTNFLLTIFFFYTAINLFFAMLYLLTGVDHLSGVDGGASAFEKFMDAFFFSSQTLTTVGYGHVAPTGMITNFIASAESLLGILVFALVTGLMYGRFARPRAYLLFSENALIAPFKGGRALMLRVCTYKNNHLTDASAQITLVLHVEEHGKMVTKFYPLNLELTNINSLALSWTIVHVIDENSPLYTITPDQIKEYRTEVIVNIKAFDDHFSNIVQQRTSYTHQQVVYGARFLPMFERAGNGSHTLLELDKVSAHERVVLHEPVNA
jgi:inward rectifier potassium channel